MITNSDTLPVIPKEKNFETHFSEILPLIDQQFNAYLKALSVKYLSYPKNLSVCDMIISSKIEEWVTLTSFSNHSIAIHVYKMLYSVQKDEEYRNLEVYDKNIILWTCLLHDIAKRGTPVIYSRDYVHPFRGARVVLHIFRRFGFVECKKETLAVWDELFEKSLTTDMNGIPCHDNSKLEGIYKLLLDIFPEECFERDVIILVLLHQSLPSLPEFNYHVVLEPLYKEIPKYFTKRLMMLMKLIIKHDSLSYLVGGKAWEKKRISERFDAIIYDILKNTNFV